jgi:hypothetical protein
MLEEKEEYWQCPSCKNLVHRFVNICKICFYDRRKLSETSKPTAKHGSPEFYELLTKAAELHDRKSHDYADKSDPFGNYHFSGKFGALFAHSPEDMGFASRLGEKIFRLSNLTKNELTPLNESIEDTEMDIAVIAILWMASRKHRRNEKELHP